MTAVENPMHKYELTVEVIALDRATARWVAEEIDRHFGRKASADPTRPYVTVLTDPKPLHHQPALFE